MAVNFLKKAKAKSLKFFVENCSGHILNAFGFKLPGQNQTLAFLKKHKLAEHAANAVTMPQVKLLPHGPVVFEAAVAEPEISFVWSLATGGLFAKQLKNGAIKVDKRVLCTDFNHHSFFKAVTDVKKRPSRKTETLIVPWAHFTDGFFFGGYYDFVFLVFAKLCRIKEALPADEFAQALIAYPLFNAPYEQQLLQLLGVAPEAVVDCRENNIKFNRVIMGNSGHWFYPNPADVNYLKKLINSSLHIIKTRNSRIYISRSGRRKIINEAALVLLLQKFGFEIIEDRYYTIAQQVELYKNASFIIGPHGASFSNIIWCAPGTHLCELFSPNYKPGHYRYLANLTGMGYSAYYHGSHVKGPLGNDNLAEDFYVSIQELEVYLPVILNKNG